LDNKNNIRIAFSIVLLSLLIGLAVGAAIVGILNAFSAIEDSTTTMVMMGISTLIIGLPVVIYLKHQRIPMATALRLNRIPLRSLLSVVLLSIGVIIIIDEFDRLIYILFGQPEYLIELAEQLKISSIYNGIILILSTVLIAPFIEEILFRGYLQKVLEDSWQDVTKAVLITSLFFAFVHLNLYWIVQIYLLGLILGYLAWRTNSIWPGLILHGLNNGFAVALNNGQDIFNKYYNWHDHVNPLWIIFAIILIVLGFRSLNHDLESES
jgi:membrane protease YdiL (CAAX protease family)